MKRLMLTLLVPLFCYAQDGTAMKIRVPSQDSIPNTGVTLKNKEVIYQKVFSSNLKKEDLLDKLTTLLTNMRNFRFNKTNSLSESNIFGRLLDYRCHIGKFERGQLDASTILSYPMNASVAVQVKDYKYRITITEIAFKHRSDTTSNATYESFIETSMTTKSRAGFKMSKDNIKTASALDQDLTDKFDLTKSPILEDF
ncbi:hypothetical protein [Pedobacter nyackensis]|uniref:hypothetical protein n=1 Tax=Pedobacter nyackensis TaxID=475255 RepID=UPI002931C189|nr:hypothetical protein [Pedobacter nyackensis]